MPSVDEYLKASNATYARASSGKPNMASIPSGWSLLSYETIPSVAIQAMALKNNSTGEVMISYEGTNLANGALSSSLSDKVFLSNQLYGDALIAAGKNTPGYEVALSEY